MELKKLKDLCQSCGMPIENNTVLMGTNEDRTFNHEYCTYCFQNGKFTTNPSMSEMIDICVPHLVNAGVDKAEARKHMSSLLPQLKRWQ